MRTLHPGLRVNDMSRSLAFYSAIGYEVVGQVLGTELGDLTLVKLPGDEFAALELIDDPQKEIVVGNGFTHLAVHVESLVDIRRSLAAAGFQPGEIELPGGANGPQTSRCADPDGYVIELTQWPAGHPAGISHFDFP